MVFEYKTPGVEFFIILSGSVRVYKPIDNVEEANRLTEEMHKQKVVPFTSELKPERSCFEGSFR